VFESLRCGYEWASNRFHQFIMEGMKENMALCRNEEVSYYCFLEERHDDDKGLLEALARDACVIVTDDFPAFFLPRMVSSAARKVRVLMEKVDSNGLLPLSVPEKAYGSAYAFRRLLQKNLPQFLMDMPDRDPLTRLEIRKQVDLKKRILSRWPHSGKLLEGAISNILSRTRIDHSVPPTSDKGGFSAGLERAGNFVDHRLSRYAQMASHPDEDATSGLSPYLHFGHISAHQVFKMVADNQDWSPDRLSSETRGKRTGWWGMDENAESFLDQLVTWRELGFNACAMTDDYDRYESLPQWAKKTLKDHLHDRRDYVYSLQEFESARTHENLWNAAQNQLLQEGVIHNYMRMVWGKKILEWSENPKRALEIMITLNNKYALDGRDPNSYSGLFWTLGRYDRPWGPERPIYGKIRYMSEKNTMRKLRMSQYLNRFGKGEKIWDRTP
jgi:deoxyribodipyrimidine photo-lyase